ncbi:MAG: N-acetylmuramoyl-L-alanine amidase, partial [Longimicrobiales bacterium]
LLLGCAPTVRDAEPRPAGAPALPPIPAVDGPLAVDVVYPEEDQALTVSDSNFIFGSVGTGRATLTINAAPVVVQPNGSFLAFLPVPSDGRYDVVANVADQRAQATRAVRVPAPAEVVDPLDIVAGSITPRGTLVVREGEVVEFGVRGVPGAEARLLLPDSSIIRLEERRVAARPEGFMRDVAVPPREFVEYFARVPVRQPLLALDTGVAAPRFGVTPDTAATAIVELVTGDDTVRVPLEASIGVHHGEARVGVVRSTRVDSVAIGQAVAGGGTPYHWFFPNGTRLPITGQRGAEYRVELTPEQTVWVSVADVELQPEGVPPVRGAVTTVRTLPGTESIDIVLGMTERLPFHVLAREDALDIAVYGAENRTNWLYYGELDPLLSSIQWEAVSDVEYRLHVELSQPLWGYLAEWDPDGNLRVRVRRPPAIDPDAPLRGLTIMVDAGHPPGGAIGPTRLTEADANLAIAKRFVELLRAGGATVFETRPDTAAVPLYERPLLAIRADADVFFSIHNNAFPDGVNPFRHAGTSMLVSRLHSVELAGHLQREVLREFGLRDLGIIWGDFALARTTWMPVGFSESMFLMIPEQEAALRDPVVQDRLAQAHLRGLEAFLRERATLAR